MPLFPELGPQYYDERDRGIRTIMEASYAEAITPNLAYWSIADTATRAEAGDCTIWSNLYGNLPGFRKDTNMGINMIRTHKNFVGGLQRKTRKSIVATPGENADASTADQFTKIIGFICKHESVLETVSEAFDGALVAGMNMLHVWIDYRQDPVSGNIRVDNCPYNSFLIDPFFKKPDLSDCNYIWRRSYLTKRECISLYPDKAEEILGLSTNDTRDGKFQFQAESYSWTTTNLLSYDEYYYRDYRPQKMLNDAETGEVLPWTGTDDESLEAFLELYPQVTVTEEMVPTVNLAITIQGKVFYDGPQPLGIDRYPFVPLFSYYNPQLPYMELRIQSLVTSLLTPQYLYNRFVINMCDILESQLNSGWMWKENALVNPNDIFLNGAGKGIAVKEEASLDDVRKIIPGEVPASMFQLAEIFKQAFSAVSGVTPENLGMADDDISGIHSMLRQGAGLTTQQIIFDHLDKAQALLGDIFIEALQVNYTPGKIKKILEGQEPSPQFYNKAFGKYHAVVEDGLNTSTQRQMQYAQLLDLRAAGIPVSDEDILEAATIQGKTKILENAAKSRMAQEQMQQMQMQSSLQEQQARTELAQARAVADKGLGLERVSRVEENHALALEREAQAEKDRDLGFLSLVKALKEIESIDLAQIEKLLQLKNMVSIHEQQVTAERAPAKENAAGLLAGLENSSLAPQAPMQEPMQNSSPLVS